MLGSITQTKSREDIRAEDANCDEGEDRGAAPRNDDPPKCGERQLLKVHPAQPVGIDDRSSHHDEEGSEPIFVNYFHSPKVSTTTDTKWLVFFLNPSLSQESLFLTKY